MSADASPIRTVAVVGAGISGVCSAAHLLRQGLAVTLFERSGIAGGVWHFDENSAPDPRYPNERPSVGDYIRYSDGSGCYNTPPRTPTRTASPGSEEGFEKGAEYNLPNGTLMSYFPPGPCYAGLKNNVSLRQMKTTLADWPQGLEDFVNQKHIEEYVQTISQSSGVDNIAQYNTRVEEVRKLNIGAWSVRTTTLIEWDEEHGSSKRLVERRWRFDAVVIASGHYNMPRIPDIPGLKDWKQQFPDRLMHSKGYRSPKVFENKRVLLIGAGVSSTDIAKECEAYSKQTFQSSRGGFLDLPPQMLPKNALRIGGIKSFHFDDDWRPRSLAPQEKIPGFIELRNGSKLRDIDNVILGTGYVTSYPYLPGYQSDEVRAEDADNDILVTSEGDMVHNLHLDIFYIQDPTLAFVGVPYHVATFSLFEFQAQVVARVFAGKAKLPATEEMRDQYRQRMAARKPGRDFHTLRPEGDELAYVRRLVEWMNKDAALSGAEPMAGHTTIFLEGYREQRQKLKALGRVFERGGQGQTFDHVFV